MSDESEAARSPLTQGSTKKTTHSEEWTLYLLTANMAGHTSMSAYTETAHVYARDENHARERAASWIAMHRHSLHLEVTAFPNGFSLQTRDLPGSITIEVSEEDSDGK